MENESLSIFISLADLLSANDLCEYLTIEKESSGKYSLKGSSNNLNQIVAENGSYIGLNKILAESSLNQLFTLDKTLNNEVWQIEFSHKDLKKYKGIKYFWNPDLILLLLSEQPGWSCFKNTLIEKFLNHIKCFCYCINIHQSTIDFITSSVENLLNYKTDYFTDKSVEVVFNLIHPEYIEEIRKLVMPDNIYNKLLAPCYKYIVTSNNNKNHFLNQKQIYIGIDNKYIGLFCYVQEPEGVLIDENNIKYINYLEFLLKSTNQGIWEYDISRKKIQYNLHLENIFMGKKHGYEIEYDVILKYIHPDDKARVIREFNAFIDSDIEILSLYFQYNLRNNNWKWLEIKGKKLNYITEGLPQKIIGVFSDVSAKKKVELLNIQKSEELEEVYLKLKTNEEIFRQLVENTNDVFMLRDEKQYIYINHQFEKIWGREITELLEDPYKMADWIHPDDVNNTEVWVDFNQMVSKKPIIEQYRIIKPDNTIHWIWTRTYPVFNIIDKLYRIVSISTDITDQKEFEDALLLAKERALESDLLKSNFLANISHEIRTPMNGIIGFAELITREDLDAQIRQNYVVIMKKSSEQLVRIIDDIIDFAKIEANQIRISLVKFNLNKLIDEISILISTQLLTAEKSNIALIETKDLSDLEAEIISDDFRIRQILSNLLDNSVKFTSEGEIHFGYVIKDNKVEFFVKDTGIGIATDKHKIIFERFRQADEGHTRKYGGTGLGLPISKGLVNILGGSIWLESVLNKGSDFYFTIPYKPESKTKPSGILTDNNLERFNWKDKLFLVAEDDDMNFEYLRIILENTNATIIRVGDGSQAVKICSKHSFDLILMDIRLPVINGIEATRHIRELGIKTPIIAQTAFAMNEDIKNCIEAGCNRYIAKPISMEKLFAMIEELIG